MEADSKNYNGDQSAVILENENLNEQNSHSQSTSSGTNEYQSQSSSSTSATINDDANVDSSQQDTKLFLGGEWISIPSILTSDETIFRMVINKGSFHSLSQASKDHLKRFLPPSRGNSFESFLDSTFTNDKNFCFGNPLKKFFEKIKAGFFTAADHVQLRDHKRVLYDHYIRHYQMNLLKKLLINRHARLERATKVQASEIDSIRVSAKNCSSQKKLQKYTIMKRRARIRAKRMIDDCRKKSGQHSGISSDESSPEDDSSTLPIPQNARSTMFSEKFSADLDLYQPVRMKEVSELYQEYSYLRETEPDCPSLDISDITLEEIYERTGISFQTERNFSKINSSFEQQPTNIARFVSKRRQKEKSGEKRGDITGNVTKSDLQSPPPDFHESN